MKGVLSGGNAKERKAKVGAVRREKRAAKALQQAAKEPAGQNAAAETQKLARKGPFPLESRRDSGFGLTTTRCHDGNRTVSGGQGIRTPGLLDCERGTAPAIKGKN
jgi:hypothetical protein